MFATIEVRKDDSKETLCFCSKEDAKRFQEFVLVYMRESGAGNGYGAYWIFDLAIGLYETVPNRATTSLETRRIEDMLSSILKARTATENPDINTVDRVFGRVNGAISFKMGELSPKQRPTVGEMFRVVSPEATREETSVGEGRVCRDLGDTLEVVNSWDEEDNGSIKPGAKRVLVKADHVMKINDWKARFRRR